MKGNSRRSDSTSESFGTIGVSGASLVIDALSETGLEGKIYVVHCSTTVGPIVGVEPEGVSRVREPESEREACEYESLDIL